jgi:hypothetical protein
MVTATLPNRPITADSPYRFVITGFDPPVFQKGENIETTYFDRKGQVCGSIHILWRGKNVLFSIESFLSSSRTGSSFSNQ